MELGLIKSDIWDFGKKYKGYKIQDIPTDYFNWIVFNSDIGGLELKRSMEELDRRGEESNIRLPRNTEDDGQGTWIDKYDFYEDWEF